MVKRAKISTPKKDHPTIDSLELSNSRSWMDFLDKEGLTLFPGRDEWRQRLIYTMLNWGQKPTSLEVMQFCIEYKIPYMSLREFDNKYPDVHEAYTFMKLMIASHRRVGSMNKKLDGTYAYKDLHKYDPEWLEINKYHSDMKKEEDKQSHTFIVDTSRPAVTTKEEMVKERERDI